MGKIYRPGQIITIVRESQILRGYHIRAQYRVIKLDEGIRVACLHCHLRIGDLVLCCKYCACFHNDWDRNPQGYILKHI